MSPSRNPDCAAGSPPKLNNAHAQTFPGNILVLSICSRNHLARQADVIHAQLLRSLDRQGERHRRLQCLKR
jgi:hypothetical protein